MTLDEYIETEIQEANRLAGRKICTDAVVLLDSSCVENVETAKKETRFLLYENDLAESLKRFCQGS